MSVTGSPSPVLTEAVPAERTGIHPPVSPPVPFLQQRLPTTVLLQGALGASPGLHHKLPLRLVQAASAESLKPLPTSSESVQAGRRAPKRTSLMQVLLLSAQPLTHFPPFPSHTGDPSLTLRRRTRTLGIKVSSTATTPRSPPWPFLLPYTLSPHTCPQRFPLSHAPPLPPPDPGPDLADDLTTEPSVHFSPLAAML